MRLIADAIIRLNNIMQRVRLPLWLGCVMAAEGYDIFKLYEGRPVWLECAPTIESLRSRLQDLQMEYAHLIFYHTPTDSKTETKGCYGYFESGRARKTLGRVSFDAILR